MVRKMKEVSVPVDEGNYAVVGSNGFRRGGLTKEKAFEMARKMQSEWDSIGSLVKMDIFYRDGSIVEWR